MAKARENTVYVDKADTLKWWDCKSHDSTFEDLAIHDITDTAAGIQREKKKLKKREMMNLHNLENL